MKCGQSGRKDGRVLEAKEHFQTTSIFSWLTKHSVVSNSSERLSNMKAEKCPLNVGIVKVPSFKDLPF